MKMKEIRPIVQLNSRPLMDKGIIDLYGLRKHLSTVWMSHFRLIVKIKAIGCFASFMKMVQHLQQIWSTSHPNNMEVVRLSLFKEQQ